jgi:hypothetical protein
MSTTHASSETRLQLAKESRGGHTHPRYTDCTVGRFFVCGAIPGHCRPCSRIDSRETTSHILRLLELWVLLCRIALRSAHAAESKVGSVGTGVLEDFNQHVR